MIVSPFQCISLILAEADNETLLPVRGNLAIMNDCSCEVMGHRGAVSPAAHIINTMLDGPGALPTFIWEISFLTISISPRFLEKASGILLSPPSVCPLCYLLPNRWTESNQIWWVACLHKWGMQEHIYFWPCPQGPWGGVKRSNINNFQYQSQF